MPFVFLKQKIKASRFFPWASDFNQRDREAYIRSVAQKTPRGALVLDVGAGEGRYKSLFDHCKYKSHDFGKYKGSESDPWRYMDLDYISDITDISAPSESFDLILCTEVLEHVPEPIRAIQEMARLLKKGGKLLITAPLGSGLHQSPYHFYGGYTPHFYEKFLPLNGLEIEDMQAGGGFFALLAQESKRAGYFLRSKVYRKWDPRWVMSAVVFSFFLPWYLFTKERRCFIEDFALGYFVLAKKIVS